MQKHIKNTIQAKGLEIALHTTDRADYISLTDVAKYKINQTRREIDRRIEKRDSLAQKGYP